MDKRGGESRPQPNCQAIKRTYDVFQQQSQAEYGSPASKKIKSTPENTKHCEVESPFTAMAGSLDTSKRKRPGTNLSGDRYRDITKITSQAGDRLGRSSSEKCGDSMDAEWVKQADEENHELIAQMNYKCDETLDDIEKKNSDIRSYNQVKTEFSQMETSKNKFDDLYDKKGIWTETAYTIAKDYISLSRLDKLNRSLPKSDSSVPHSQSSSKRLSSLENRPQKDEAVTQLLSQYNELLEYDPSIDDYKFPNWHIERKPLDLSTQIKRGDFLKKLICCDQSSKEDRPTRVNKLADQINAELQELRQVLQTSNFSYTLKYTIAQQIDKDIKQIQQSYDQALKYDGYLARQGSAAREKAETELKERLRNLQGKREGLVYVKELGVSDIDGLKNKINHSINELPEELTTFNKISEAYFSFECSCLHKNFLEASKWAKRFRDEKVACEMHLEKVPPGAATLAKKDPSIVVLQSCIDNPSRDRA